VGWFSYWLRYGSAMTDAMIANVEPDAAVFRIVGL
jgi:hypothetical protein